jgi:hypothetical protein
MRNVPGRVRMTEPKKDPAVKTIVVPKALEEFFAEKLRARYAERDDVEIIIDRRDGERRHSAMGGNGADESASDAERRELERRVLAGWWSLPDLPFETEKAS